MLLTGATVVPSDVCAAVDDAGWVVPWVEDTTDTTVVPSRVSVVLDSTTEGVEEACAVLAGVLVMLDSPGVVAVVACAVLTAVVC